MHQKASRHHRRAMSDCLIRRVRYSFAKIAATAQLLDISGRYMQSGRQILFPIPQNPQGYVR